MKLYFDPNNKWCLIIEDNNNTKKKHYIAIPPTDKDRTDIISDKEIFCKKDSYCYGFRGIIVRIRNSILDAELIK